MILNYLKQTWRSLVKNKTYSILNIVGLSAGLICFAFIAVWVTDELSYDRFNKNYNRIVRLTGIAKTESGISESAVSSAPMAKALKDDYAEVESTVRFEMRGEIVRLKDKQLLEDAILVTEPSFFNVFSFQLTMGDVMTALSEPYSIILTKTAAKKYFGDSDPMGQVLTINMYDSAGIGAQYKVTGIMPDAPKNSHFTFNMLASFKTVEVANPDVLTVDGWGDASFYTYLLLKKGVDHKKFSEKISQFYRKYIGERYDVWKSIYFYKLQPLADIHLKSHLEYEIAAAGSITNVYVFSTIGFLILLLAGINYMNLATARSVSRVKEVSVRKVVGALRRQLTMQYLMEAIITAFIALALSLVACYLLQPLFFQLTGKDFSPFESPLIITILVAVTVLLGGLSGIYPAFIISGFRPASVLKGAFKSGTRGVLLRRSLLVSQFMITIILVSGIIIINSQMSYIRHKDLGYNKDALLFLRVHGNTEVINGFNAFKNELAGSPLISGITTSNSLLISGLGSGGSQTVDLNGNPLQVNTSRLRVDPHYMNVHGIRLLAGKDFSANAAADTIRQIIVNEQAVKRFGWKDPEAAIGKPFEMGNQKGIVRGVVNDFHFNSLQEAIEPLAIYPIGDRFSRIIVKGDIKKVDQSIAAIEKAWKKYFPSALFDYNFMDEQIGEQYAAEKRFAKIFLYFSVLSLLIACLGLYGLTAYSASQKVKEIGVRKVLGATVNNLAMMLSRDFFKLVLLAFVMAVPLAWYIMDNWLTDFAYRTNISWWMFGMAGLLVLVIAVITVSFQVIKAAIANPVKSLRTE
ncbi:MAG TPA: ABC transporter permease [Chitinophagaceae bacterium]|nr:ABC transporter permease [Chitinophagaceae bacterium]